MKKFLKKLLQRILRIFAKAILKKYQPDIIGITGSVGKTSAKEAVFSVLSRRFKVRKNIKNYNNEIGLPLTIIGASSGGRSVWGWVGVLAKALVLLVWKDRRYPEILILEMAVDRPGDMKYLTDLAACRLGIVTHIGPVHLEFFKTIEKIAKEKSVIVSHLDKNGWAILNCDNQYIYEMKEATKGRVLTFGIKDEKTDIRAAEINFFQNENGVVGLNFKMFYQGNAVPVLLPNILGEHLVYAALCGAATGIIYGMNLVEISQNLRLFEAPKGRLHLINGIKDTLIIDDTYNASPDSVLAALSALARFDSDGRKFAVLGDMLELGEYTEIGHRQVGEEAVGRGVDILITVGERARMIADEAEKRGMDKDKIFSFSDVGNAGRFLQERLETGDLILVKGSQGMRLEKIVKEIMAEPLRAKELLVRQEKPWE
ncbi:MAG: Mur ligase family protein [Patescibacteria group bacterium]